MERTPRQVEFNATNIVLVNVAQTEDETSTAKENSKEKRIKVQPMNLHNNQDQLRLISHNEKFKNLLDLLI